MFPDYNFLREIPIESPQKHSNQFRPQEQSRQQKILPQFEQFWCFHQPNAQHHKMTIIPFKPDSKLAQSSIKEVQEKLNKLSSLHHPNLVHSENTWLTQDKLYIAEVFANSSTIKESLNGGRLSIKSALTVSIQLFDCLHYLHIHGFHHQALNPNLLYLEKDHLKVSAPVLQSFLKDNRLLPDAFSPQEMKAYRPASNIKADGDDLVFRDIFAAAGVMFYLYSGHHLGTVDPEMLTNYELEPAYMELIDDLRSPKTKLNAKQTLKKRLFVVSA